MRITSPTQAVWFWTKLSCFPVMGFPWMVASLTGAAAVSTIVFSVPAQAAILSSWEYNPSNYELEIIVPGGTTPRYSLAAEPARIIVDLPNTTIGTVSHQQTYGGAIREIRVAQHEPGVTRIVLELSPGTVLAPGHVELRQVGGSGNAEHDRWVLRPLLVTDSPQTATSPSPAAPASSTPTSSSETASPSDRQSAYPPALPPLEPGALEIPIEPPQSLAQAEAVLPTVESESEFEGEVGEIEEDVEEIEVSEASEASEAATELETADRPTSADSSDPSEADLTYGTSTPVDEEVSREDDGADTALEQAEPAELAAPEAAIEPSVAAQESLETEANLNTETLAPVAIEPNFSEADLPQLQPREPTAPIIQPSESLPAFAPALPQGDAVVVVPPLDLTPEERSVNDVEASSADVPDAPISNFSTANPAAENASSTPNAFDAQSDRPLITAFPMAAPRRVIEFGQPLSASSATDGGSAEVLPSGTVLRLRYPGAIPLQLVEGQFQEVLVLAAPIVNAVGQVILAEGSQVIGRFETRSGRSQFVTQAIALQGRNVLLKAESSNLADGSAEARVQPYAVGGTAEAVVGEVPGVPPVPVIAELPPNALSEIAPRVVIQPNQVVEVQLTEDLRL
jgi:hypothetical protein